MSLNKTDGEILPGLGRGVMATPEKWLCIPNLFPEALAAAYDAFDRAGAAPGYELGPSNLLIQEYHLHGLVVFIWWKQIDGIDKFYHYTFELSPELISELALIGKWPALYAALPNMRAN